MEAGSEGIVYKRCVLIVNCGCTVFSEIIGSNLFNSLEVHNGI